MKQRLWRLYCYLAGKMVRTVLHRNANSGARLKALQGWFCPAIVKFVGTLRRSGARSSNYETRNQKALSTSS